MTAPLLLAAALACGETVGPDEAPTTTTEPTSVASLAPPRSAFNFSDAPRTIFTDVTDSAGVRFQHHQYETELQPVGAGALVFDFDNDGLHDIYVTDSIGPNALFRNNGDGTFTDVARAVGVDNPEGHSNGGCAVDYDNDGDQDLYLTNYGSSKLFRNNGDATFADVTAASGVGDAELTLRSTGCAWGDYDLDGHLDVIVVRHLRELNPQTLVDGDFYKAVGTLVLYHSNGDGTFSVVTDLLGDTSRPSRNIYAEPLGNLWGAGFQPGWIDIDNDGDLDLYVVNDWGPNAQPNVLWRNDGAMENGSWSFVDVSEESGAGVPMYGMSLAVGDYNLDGHLDMFMTNIGASVLLKNNGDGKTFTDVAAQAGTEMAKIGTEDRVTWGSMFFDYDNDGLEDLYIISGYLRLPGVINVPFYMREQHNILLRNNGNETFADVSVLSGADDSGVGRGLAYLDIDNDGCLDMFVGNLGGEARLFRNACDSGNNWLVVRIVGTDSNRDGIGARVTLEAGGKTQTREVSSGRSFMGQHMRPSHFGLGPVTTADTVTVRWPSGKVQTLADVAANQRLTITEPGDGA